MKLRFFQEPELEFGNGGTHVDIRYGLTRHGPLDLGEASAPSQLKVGLVGTEETIAGIRQWFDRCREGIAAKQSKLSNLFPPFPGFSENSSFVRPWFSTTAGPRRFDNVRWMQSWRTLRAIRPSVRPLDYFSTTATH